MEAKRLLIVEDDPDIAHLVEITLKDIGFNSTVSDTGDDGLQKGLAGNYDMIILDLMLPGMNGVDVCRKLREGGVSSPIIMLTAKAAEVDKIVGLESGADDYITKPFIISELQARVKARLRRREGEYDKLASARKQGANTIISAGLSIDIERRKVVIEGEEAPLTAKDFDLLVHFAQNPGRVYKREQLLDSVWGYGFEGYEHTVNSHINRLRTKIEKDPASPEYILTVWGVGYKFRE